MSNAEILTLLGRSSLEAGVLVLLVLVTQRLFRRHLTPQWRCALWLLVMVRLLPISLGSVTSIFNLMPRWPEPRPAAVAVKASEPVKGSAAAEPVEVVPTMRVERESGFASRPAYVPEATVSWREAWAERMMRWGWSDWLLAGWLTGAALMGIHVLWTTGALARRFRRARRIDDPAALEVLRRAGRDLGIARLPALLESEAVTSPALFGVWRPRLLLPAGFLGRFSAAELRFVLLHELAHLKRRDLVLNWVVTILQIIHWFNPLIWLGFARWRLDREIACDALALEADGATQNRAYGHTILRLLEGSLPHAPLPGLVGILEDKAQLRERLRRIANYTPSRRWPLLAAAAMGVLAVIGLTDAQVPGTSGTRTMKITVLDAATEKPVAGARVATWGNKDNPGVLTDAKGIAAVTLPADDVRYGNRQEHFGLSVSQAGYAARQATWFTRGSSVRETLPESYTFKLKPGMTVSGTVRDEHGTPIAGAKLRLWGHNRTDSRLRPGDRQQQEYSTLLGEKEDVTTDQEGRWQQSDFPEDLTALSIEVTRPGGAPTRFSTPELLYDPDHLVVPITIEEIKRGGTVFTLKDGVTVRGVVVDTGGRPVGNAELHIRASHNPNSLFYTLMAGPDGRFELQHRIEPAVDVTALHAGYASKTMTLEPVRGGPEVRIVLGPERPLILRIVGEHDEPLADAEIGFSEYLSRGQLFEWNGRTDAAGRVTWAGAPDELAGYEIMAKDYPRRGVKLQADGKEQVVRLRHDADKRIAVRLHVVDAETAQPVESFEVWRNVQGRGLAVWGEPSGKGDFTADLLHDEFTVSGSMETYRLQVRAVGYARWNSERIDFAEGDQALTVKLTRGEAGAPVPSEQTVRVTLATHAGLRPLAEAVVRLLESGEVEDFVQATHATLADWDSLVPKNAPPGTSVLGKSADAHIDQKAKFIRRSATRLVATANRLGAKPGLVHYRVKSVTAPTDSSVIYTVAGQKVQVPNPGLLTVVLEGEPVNAPAGLRGDYEIVIGNAMGFPTGWRIETGVSWNRLPAALIDPAEEKDFALLRKIAVETASFSPVALSEPDDAALGQLGGVLADFLRTRDVDGLLAGAVLSREDTQAFWARNDWGTAAESAAATEKLMKAAMKAARELLAPMEREGIDLSGARIRLRRVEAERPRFRIYGALEDASAGPVHFTFGVETDGKSKTGRALSGDYTLSLSRIRRVNGRWTLDEGKMRWEQLPAGLLTADDRKALELENYLAEHRTFPPGMTAPEIELPRFTGDERVKLAQLRGKVVVLEFWASWCGPCQEPMAKLQHLREQHADWGTQVEIVTVSIDDQPAAAAAHLAKNDWTKTFNLWAGPGGFDAVPAKAYRVKGVPTVYVIGRDGKIVQGGHPMSLDLGRLVDAQLKR